MRSNHLTPFQSPPSDHPVFFGPQGLRAGWSLVIFILIFGGLLGLVLGSIHALHLHPSHDVHHEQPVALVLLYEGSVFLSVLLASWLLSRIEHRPLRLYGLGLTPRAPQQFLLGLAAGLLFLSLLVAALRTAHLLAFHGLLLSTPQALLYGLLWLAAFLFVALSEEYLLRGFLQFTLARGLAGIASTLRVSPARARTLGFWLAALLLSFVFGFGHRTNPGESPVGLLAAGLVGLAFCLSLWRTGSLWWAVGLHTSWDWAQSFLFGVPDSGGLMQHHLLASEPLGPVLWSGGLTGPEGSLLVLPTIALIVAALFLTTRPAPLADPLPTPDTTA